MTDIGPKFKSVHKNIRIKPRCPLFQANGFCCLDTIAYNVIRFPHCSTCPRIVLKLKLTGCHDDSKMAGSVTKQTKSASLICQICSRAEHPVERWLVILWKWNRQDVFTPTLMERDGLIVETHYYVVQPGPIPGSSNNNVRSRPIKPLPDTQGVKPLLRSLTWLEVVLHVLQEDWNQQHSVTLQSEWWVRASGLSRIVHNALYPWHLSL